MIRLVDVERFYQAGPTRTYVLRRINLEIREGEFVTIMGPVGGGEVHPARHPGPARPQPGPANTGSWASRSTPLPPKKRVELNKRHIGFVFQKYHLIDDLTVYENLEIPLSYRDVKPKERGVDRGARRSTGSRWWGRRTSSPASSRAGSSSWWAWPGR